MVRYSQRQKPYRQAAGVAAKGVSVVGTALSSTKQWVLVDEIVILVGLSFPDLG